MKNKIEMPDKSREKHNKGSFKQPNTKVQTVKSGKSPSPQKLKLEMEQRKQYQSNLTEAFQSLNPATKRKISSLGKSNSSRTSYQQQPATIPKEILNFHTTFKTTVSAVTNQPILKNKFGSNQPYKPLASSRPPITAIQTNNQILNVHKKKQMVSQLISETRVNNRKSKPDLHDNPLSPGFISNQSPRFTIGAGMTTGATSVYSMTTESIANTSTYNNNGKEKKMCLSEKLAPKGKKKRVNAQKQPKQISITREQIILQPFMSIYSTHHETTNGNFILQRTESDNEPPASSLQTSSIQIQMIDSRNDQNMTPGTSYKGQSDEKGTISKFQRETYSPMKDDDITPQQMLFNDPFSFQVGNQATFKHSIIEESKDQTGIFGQANSAHGGQLLETLGNEVQSRPSIDYTIDKKRIQEIPTPVFQGNTNRSQSSIRPNDVVYHLDIKLTDDSPLQKNRNSIASEIKPTPEFKTEKEPEEVKVEYPQEKKLQKVYSTNDIGMNKSYNSVQVQSNYLQRNQSTSGFFSRIKSYFGGSKAQSEKSADARAPQVDYRCNCGYSGKSYACVRALKWLSYSQNYSEKEYEKNKQLYQGLIKLQTVSGSENQIERDIPRTFPNADPYMNTDEGQQRLSRVLNAFSQYFSAIGYVQGMNFVVGAILMHCSEDIAFWLFVSLIEDYEMRDIYQPKLPGLFKHSQVLQLLLMEHLEELYNHFTQHNILIEMYASDWIFALFSNIIPISQYHHFLDQFFIGGWPFFYKFSLTFLKCLQIDVVNCDDISEILTIIKLKFTKKDHISQNILNDTSYTYELDSIKLQSETTSTSPHKVVNLGSTGQMSQMKSLFKKFMGQEDIISSESFKDEGVWERVVSLSCKEWEDEFNENFVLQLLASFDADKMVFKQSMPNTPRQMSVVSSAQKSSQNISRRNSSLPSTSKIQQKEEIVSKFDAYKDYVEPKVEIKSVNNSIKNPRQNKIFMVETVQTKPTTRVNSKNNNAKIKSSRSQQNKRESYRFADLKKQFAP